MAKLPERQSHETWSRADRMEHQAKQAPINDASVGFIAGLAIASVVSLGWPLLVRFLVAGALGAGLGWLNGARRRRRLRDKARHIAAMASTAERAES